ncbi:TetR/AcrR family transcriptional regulator [Mycolicibacterium bacteremicum]|uniref:TetR family transcriptional regulator n=1 Tax=Mycolicibacterium bacteremicum TaxID=564198 RepID=A0A1W9YY98_MYCBA|nr:TetR/AcrR family transcriptional regulator [Mycolicibacterium bacteremicum]MCV7431279.1 TetR/AcrR family transcriptional regulator [Mycolicibacterium bacteremicum]ORA05051.1 TetR family transcriptional regulator [Mycolicibacterium bacteremicum]
MSTTGRLAPTTYSAAQKRVIVASLDLFGTHGVSGTSLQMIADAIGVTKAAVYHQFKSKDEVVIAVAETELAALQDAVDAAEAEPDQVTARDVLLTRVVDMAVTRRQLTGVLQFDPVVVRLLAEHEPFAAFIERLYQVLLGEGAGVEARVNAAVMSGALSAAVMHPLVTDVDDDTLRTQILKVTRRILDLPQG